MDPVNWQKHLARSAQGMSSSAIRDLLKLTEQSEVISLAGGLPAPEFFPSEEIAAACEQALVEAPVAALQYGPTEGYAPLREFVAERVSRLGITVQASQILISSGSQQALDLLGKILIDPGTSVAVEAPTYLGALQAWQPYQPSYVTLPMDDQGLDVTVLEQLLRDGTRPRFLYVVPNFQNPTGVRLAEDRRELLLSLAERYDLPIIEDDPYGELYYDGERPTTLAAAEIRRYGELRRVIYLSTFSKLLTPGLRVGWVVAPAALAAQLAIAKQGLDLHTGSLNQIAVYYACRDGLIDRHLPRLRDEYRGRRDTMLAALTREMPADCTWNRPGGGMFLWLSLPGDLDATTLLPQAVDHGVAFVPGGAFYPLGGGANTMRLNFSFPRPSRIEEAIRRLGATVGASLQA
jgi:2-aminoadipate transaminase